MHHLEYDASYTIGLVSFFLLARLFGSLLEAIPGAAGVVIIALSIVVSKRAASTDIETISR